MSNELCLYVWDWVNMKPIIRHQSVLITLLVQHKLMRMKRFEKMFSYYLVYYPNVHNYASVAYLLNFELLTMAATDTPATNFIMNDVTSSNIIFFVIESLIV